MNGLSIQFPFEKKRYISNYINLSTEAKKKQKTKEKPEYIILRLCVCNHHDNHFDQKQNSKKNIEIILKQTKLKIKLDFIHTEKDPGTIFVYVMCVYVFDFFLD